ncbi:MAG TPA: ribosome small subunit-dependent GTPase A [Denitromonas sp.]|uniref:ribosome small subunit-dependent GTPase A n=1 Tax=Denitromonas sp. TaxID=2734609 RepID=UPI001D9633B8|nr:ribosome small subunit-dependent GTPase A [Rhodocyclaceae bacterium]MCP5220903.1 ribosome small subunit-dependent GTPase A [Zoogloeaceae bacterium]HPR07509.1 ribosome small subunit-dependent GTPase A [Denitromonas sp.]HQU87205.1 ribosome small subunit-dependent GTPase A [Denitromonas sp.]HQV13530.1 ribosome small subunit-dependent GTPase A [Denitromonas sp.]
MNQGTIVASFGRQFEVLDTHGERWLCVTRGKRIDFACGDKVEFNATSAGHGVIQKNEARQSLLHRSDAFRQKLLAANVSQILIVVATEPSFSDELISRCLCAAEHQSLKARIVLNKADVTAGLDDARRRLAMFTALGYELIELSAMHDVSALAAVLSGETSVLVGQSGMGKSTLTNALIPDANAATREISAALDTGKHTTTTTRLYALPGGGALIDSPGLQAFGLAHLTEDDLLAGFCEFAPLLGKCRFRNCKHDAEPGCALLTAVEEGVISARRFSHYRLLHNEIHHAKRLSQGW